MCYIAETGSMECTSASSSDNADTFEQNHTPLIDKERFVPRRVGFTVQGNSSVVLNPFMLYITRQHSLTSKFPLHCTNHLPFPILVADQQHSIYTLVNDTQSIEACQFYAHTRMFTKKSKETSYI